MNKNLLTDNRLYLSSWLIKRFMIVFKKVTGIVSITVNQSVFIEIASELKHSRRHYWYSSKMGRAIWKMSHNLWRKKQLHKLCNWGKKFQICSVMEIPWSKRRVNQKNSFREWKHLVDKTKCAQKDFATSSGPMKCNLQLML